MNTIKFRITATTEFPMFRIDDIVENLGVEPTVAMCNGKEFTAAEVKDLPYGQEKSEWIFMGECHIADMLGWVAKLPEGNLFIS